MGFFELDKNPFIYYKNKIKEFEETKENNQVLLNDIYSKKTLRKIKNTGNKVILLKDSTQAYFVLMNMKDRFLELTPFEILKKKNILINDSFLQIPKKEKTTIIIKNLEELDEISEKENKLVNKFINDSINNEWRLFFLYDKYEIKNITDSINSHCKIKFEKIKYNKLKKIIERNGHDINKYISEFAPLISLIKKPFYLNLFLKMKEKENNSLILKEFIKNQIKNNEVESFLFKIVKDKILQDNDELEINDNFKILKKTKELKTLKHQEDNKYTFNEDAFEIYFAAKLLSDFIEKPNKYQNNIFATLNNNDLIKSAIYIHLEKINTLEINKKNIAIEKLMDVILLNECSDIYIEYIATYFRIKNIDIKGFIKKIFRKMLKENKESKEKIDIKKIYRINNCDNRINLITLTFIMENKKNIKNNKSLYFLINLLKIEGFDVTNLNFHFNEDKKIFNLNKNREEIQKEYWNKYLKENKSIEYYEKTIESAYERERNRALETDRINEIPKFASISNVIRVSYLLKRGQKEVDLKINLTPTDLLIKDCNTHDLLIKDCNTHDLLTRNFVIENLKESIENNSGLYIGINLFYMAQTGFKRVNLNYYEILECIEYSQSDEATEQNLKKMYGIEKLNCQATLENMKQSSFCLLLIYFLKNQILQEIDCKYIIKKIYKNIKLIDKMYIYKDLNNVLSIFIIQAIEKGFIKQSDIALEIKELSNRMYFSRLKEYILYK